MQTITQLDSSKQYNNKPVKITILDVGEEISYTRREHQSTCTVAMADKTGVIKAEVYNLCKKKKNTKPMS